MKYDVFIYGVAQGEERVYRVDGDPDWEGFGDSYMWDDGNYGCDCNRAIFFHRAGHPGMSGPDAYASCDDAECGEKERYRVLIRERDTNNVLYEDRPLNPIGKDGNDG